MLVRLKASVKAVPARAASSAPPCPAWAAITVAAPTDSVAASRPRPAATPR